MVDVAVALSSSQNVIWVTIGGLLGHAICSAVAVMGGRLLATRISPRTVSLVGGVLFLLFGIVGLYASFNEYKD
jgi:putative Ca2+/H+ antiporter (TMEM165/GDT1 family)